MSIIEQERPQIHMIWPTSVRPQCPAVAAAPGYTIRTYQEGDEQAFLSLISLSDFDPWDDEKLTCNINLVIPKGWFFAVDDMGQIVATAMAQHNYSGLSPLREMSAGSSVTPTTGVMRWVWHCAPA
jgi:hypothetical protein